MAGESENFGPEQERLNNALGARLRITTLRAAAGPGVELLEYLAPRDGRPAPVDLKANDLAYWQIYFVVSDAEAAFSAALGGEGALISPGVVALADGRLGFRHGTLARDPDGHAVELAEP